MIDLDEKITVTRRQLVSVLAFGQYVGHLGPFGSVPGFFDLIAHRPHPGAVAEGRRTEEIHADIDAILAGPPATMLDTRTAANAALQSLQHVNEAHAKAGYAWRVCLRMPGVQRGKSCFNAMKACVPHIHIVTRIKGGKKSVAVRVQCIHCGQFVAAARSGLGMNPRKMGRYLAIRWAEEPRGHVKV